MEDGRRVCACHDDVSLIELSNMLRGTAMIAIPPSTKIPSIKEVPITYLQQNHSASGNICVAAQRILEFI